MIARNRIAFRIHGEVVRTEHPCKEDLFEAILKAQPSDRDTDAARQQLEGPDGAADFAMEIGGLRLRANVYRWQGGYGAALRPIPKVVSGHESLGIPSHLMEFVLKTQHGLILINGSTGSGKTTTLNCFIEHINAHRAANILSIEEPIEYLYEPKKSTIQQREIGKHVENFAEALRAALRQNPNVIVVGEIRDYPTLLAALQGAETGHLVFGTLHTHDAASTVNRLANMAPPSQQGQIRTVLATTLKMIVCQKLFKRSDRPGRVAGREVLINTTAIASLIRDGKDHQISSSILTQSSAGMIDWGSSLKLLYCAGLIDRETLESVSSQPHRL